MLVMNQSLSKVFIWFVLDDSVAINISEREDGSGFKLCDLFRGFLHDDMDVRTTGNINILTGSHYEDNTLLILILITRPPYLEYPTQPPGLP